MEIFGSLVNPALLRYGIQGIFVALIIYRIFFRRNKSKNSGPKLTEQKKDELIEQWMPEPLVSYSEETKFDTLGNLVEGKMGKVITVQGRKCVNFATANFLNFVGNERIESEAKKAVKKYGVGSCGPRGFYGTVDVHLELEKQIAEFMQCEEAVLYSYGFATIASAIPAYAKRGDIIYADKGVNFAIQKGLQASRSRIVWFEHNDINDLEKLLKHQEEEDKADPATAKSRRKFIVIEGMYAKTADFCPLPQIMELKWKYKVRIFMDESFSFGVMGKTGRGITEHYSVSAYDIDMIMVSLENAIASTGGFCCGRSFVVGHQRLSGLGYCFSASLPPLLAKAASEAISIIDEEPQRVENLQEKSKRIHDALIQITKGTNFRINGERCSPMKYIHYDSHEDEKADYELNQLKETLFKKGFVTSRSRFLDSAEAFPVEKGLKIMCNSDLTDEELQNFVIAFRSAVHSSFK